MLEAYTHRLSYAAMEFRKRKFRFFWSGGKYWDDRGRWRVQTCYKRGGIENIKHSDILEVPDQHWIRSAEKVRHLMHSYASEILSNLPELEQIKGGFAFTKEHSALNFQPGKPLFWGTLDFWTKTIHQI